MDSSSSSSPKGTYDDHDNELKLNPGVPARRNRSSGCKCVLIIILTSLGSLIALFVGIFLVNTFRLKQEPHAPLLYKTKSVDTVDPAAVVRPLIDEKQTFDIVATVWLRTNDSSSASTTSTLPAEKAIFTGKVFEGLTLKHKDIHATVNYSVPTEIFKNHDLKDYDLRASFVLIPTSPSLLDNLTNYSSWRNERISLPPFRYWSDTGPAPTLQDKAIDSFGVSIGLLQFFGTRSQCGHSTNTANASEHTPVYDSGDEDSDDEFDGDENYTTEQLSKANHSQSMTTHSRSKGKPVLESHPYIISHSFIRAVDMTKLYDRKAYNQAHKKLKTNVCGLASSPPNYDWTSCDLRIHENMDTRLQLKMAEEGSGNKLKHWAYPPSLSLSSSAWTPNDLVRVPVNREDCTKGGRFNVSAPLLPDQEFVDITWEIVYSGRSPIKLMLSEVVIPLTHYNITDIEEFPQEMQLIMEMIQGLRGNRSHKGSHPRRMFFRATLVAINSFIIQLIDILYWHTRSSTIGISKFATILFAVVTLVNYSAPVVLSIYEEHFLITLLATLTNLPLELLPFLMLKVIWRMEFGWNQKKGKDKWTERAKKMKKRCAVPVPNVRFAKATHDERASDRLDARTPWTVKLSLFISCCLAYFFFSPTSSLFLIPPLGLRRTPQFDKYKLQLHITLVESLIFPGLIVGSGLQLWFNYQSRTFAGKYKLSAILDGINLMLNLMHFSTRVLGHREVRDGFSVHDLVNACLVLVWCYQAVMLPRVRQEVDDDEVE